MQPRAHPLASTPPLPTAAPPPLHVEGRHLVDPDGATITLKGCSLGGWMNLENFITGYPGSEQAMRTRLAAVIGADAYEAFFEAFYVDFFDEADAAFLASLGLNSMRIPLNYRHFEHDDRPFELIEAGFARLDRVVSLLGRHGIYTILDLHAAPGRQNHHWHSDNATHEAAFWTHRHFQDRAVHLWEALAERYRDRPEVAGYNPLNEPADESGVVLPAFYRRVHEAIRAVDPHTTLFLDGNRYATDFSCFDEPFPNTVFACHDYALAGIAGATGYPGTVRGEWVDRAVLEREFLRRSEYMRRTGTPIWVGEFGPVYPRHRPDDSWRFQVLADQLSIYREHEASWSLWPYKDIGLQGLVHTTPDSPYARRIEPVRLAKERLGTDSWGGTDAGVRDVLDPIDALFDREFPDYEPYPWGRRQHIFLLVRHLLLAEPLIERYAELFRGLGADEMAELAHSFRFERCAVRAPLADALRADTGDGR